MTAAASGFEKREIGTTGLKVTTLGLGGATLAGIFTSAPEAQARATIQRANDIGITLFDTAPQYAFGRSEHLMGNVLRDQREGSVLATKVGRLLKPFFGQRPEGFNWPDALPFDQVYDYSYDGIMRSFEDSLQRLGLNAVDVLYVHDIGAATHGVEGNKPYWEQLKSGGYKALRQLRESGTIKAIGLGVNEWEVLMDAMALGDWDVFLLAGRYTLLEQRALYPFLETCLARKSSVVIGGPFNSGILVGGSTWNYGKAPAQVVARVQKLEAVCKAFNVPLAAAALQFPLAHRAVCNVLPGPRTPEELDQIVAWWRTSIPDELWATLAHDGLVAPGTPLPGGLVA